MKACRKALGRRDANEPEIVKALRALPGTSVVQLDAPLDLLVGRRGVNLLLEVKDGSKPPSKRRLTDKEQAFFDSWEGQRAVVEDSGEAVSLVLDLTGG